MKCPSCKSETMVRGDEAGKPATLECSVCHGRWLAFDDHLAWVEGQGTASVLGGGVVETAIGAGGSGGHAQSGAVVGAEPVAKARLCPKCGKVMGRYRASADHGFALDRCGACAGIWFDAGEWEAVGTIVPLERVQHIFNDTHQHRLAAELRRRQHEERCRAIVGDEAFAKVCEFKAWLEAQPRREVLLAYLEGEGEEGRGNRQ